MGRGERFTDFVRTAQQRDKLALQIYRALAAINHTRSHSVKTNPTLQQLVYRKLVPDSALRLRMQELHAVHPNLFNTRCCMQLSCSVEGSQEIEISDWPLPHKTGWTMNMSDVPEADAILVECNQYNQRNTQDVECITTYLQQLFEAGMDKITQLNTVFPQLQPLYKGKITKTRGNIEGLPPPSDEVLTACMRLRLAMEKQHESQ